MSQANTQTKVEHNAKPEGSSCSTDKAKMQGDKGSCSTDGKQGSCGSKQ